MMSGFELYSSVSHEVAAGVISRYSTSFGAAVTLLDEPVRSRVRDIYAMVRVADEVVDGAAPLPTDTLRALLDDYEQAVLTACERGFSTDLVVHAFAQTARECEIGPDLIAPFFASMRADLEPETHDVTTLADYVYGSAEVVGLMCLKAFLVEHPHPQAWERLSPGARRLGAAFQKVNFLRDLAADENELGRHYLPGTNAQHLNEESKKTLIADIYADLDAADRVISKLPSSSRVAVRAAYLLFRELTATLEATPAEEIARRRIRVSDPRKAALVAQAYIDERVKPRWRRLQATSRRARS